VGLLELFSLVEDEEEKNSYIRLVKENINRLNSITDELIELFHVSKKGDKLAEKIEWKPFLQCCIDEIGANENAERVRIDFTLAEDFPTYSDPVSLKIILRNLLSNALKYYNPKQENPYVQISVLSQEEQFVISVKDNGIGIGKDDLEKVFEPFFRATEVSKGVGLGLNLVRQVASQLNGRIDVASEIGQGTTFTLTFPNRKPTENPD